MIKEAILENLIEGDRVRGEVRHNGKWVYVEGTIQIPSRPVFPRYIVMDIDDQYRSRSFDRWALTTVEGDPRDDHRYLARSVYPEPEKDPSLVPFSYTS